MFQSGGSLMKKSYEITSTIHTPTDIGVWINDEIAFQVSTTSHINSYKNT